MDKTHRWRTFLVAKAFFFFFLMFYCFILGALFQRCPDPHTLPYTYGFHVKWVDIMPLRFFFKDNVNDAMITSHRQLCWSRCWQLCFHSVSIFHHSGTLWKDIFVMTKHGYWDVPLLLQTWFKLYHHLWWTLLFYGLFSLIVDLIFHLSSALLCTTSDDN
jgi:hypothetical protein